MQTVYLKILEGRARYRGESNLKTWLFAVIRKTAITEQRKRLLRILKVIATSNPTQERNPSAAEPAAAFERSETQKQFQRALDACLRANEKCCTWFFMKIGACAKLLNVMGVSIGSARHTTTRGKKHLRES